MTGQKPKTVTKKELTRLIPDRQGVLGPASVEIEGHVLYACQRCNAMGFLDFHGTQCGDCKGTGWAGGQIYLTTTR